uniref:SUN domain-containing protein n=1 Tax=Amphiprion ocellaris TaxID=80972 RepID=A0AAQ5ZMN2_AMPOC
MSNNIPVDFMKSFRGSGTTFHTVLPDLVIETSPERRPTAELLHCGECQWVSLEFPKSVKVSELKVQFQGGFSAKTCTLEGCPKDGDSAVLSQFYPEDNNSLQSFPIQEAPAVDKVKIMFENSADFFGRIIVYSLDVLGERAS